jgi:hypothetical protein
MNKHETKWVAGFDFEGQVTVSRCQCRETDKLVIVGKPTNGEERRAQGILSYKTRLDKSQAKRILHDSADDALAALHRRQVEAVKRAEKEVERAQWRLVRIERYDTILEGKS